MSDIQDLLKEFSDTISQKEVEEEINELPELPKNYLRAVSFEIGYKVINLDAPFEEGIWDFLITLIRPEIFRQLIKPYFMNLDERRSDRNDLIKAVKELHTSCKENYIDAGKKIHQYCKSMSQWKPAYQTDMTSKRISEIQSLFKLTELEAKVVTLFFMKDSITSVSSLLTHERNITDLDKSLSFYRNYLEASENEVREIFHHQSNLRKYGILFNPDLTDLHAMNMKLNTSLPVLISSQDQVSLSEKFFPVLQSKKINPLESFALDETSEKILINLLTMKKGAAIHLRGPSQTGKSELARTLAKTLGKKLHVLSFINNDRPGGDVNLTFQKLALIAADKSLNPDESILFFDESLDFAESEWGDKWLREFITNSRIKQIWATKSGDSCPHVFKDAFNFSLKLENSLEKLKKIADIKSDELKLPHEVTTAFKASISNVPPSLIKNSLEDIKCMLDSGKLTSKEVSTTALAMFGGDRSATSGNSQLNPMVDNYLPTLINTSVSPEHLINVMIDFRNKLTSNTLPPDVRNYNLLFYGAPGTGKTEFAKYISHHVGAPFIIRRSSDIVSKWLGESEKNIRDLFKQAEDENAVLFLDECDSMFPPRQNALRSYETTRTNEMLVAMENFKGILICCTNFKDTLDSAAGRRFAQKVKFDYLIKENIPVFFEKFFNQTLTSELRSKLAKINNIAPGDFNIVRKRMLMEKIEDTAELIKILEEEVSHKQKSGSGKRLGL